MTETLLVRAAGGGWEELQPRTKMPEGGVADVFGDDLGPVLGAAAPLVVAACAPALAAGRPDAVCLDPDGGVWIVQLALDGDGADALPALIGAAGALTGMAYGDFETLCDRRGSDPLATFVGAAAGTGFDAAGFERALTATLAAGRMRIVAIVREAAPALVQSMRFLNASGAAGLVLEASAFASASVSAIRARMVDVGEAADRPARRAATSASPASEPPAAVAAPAESPPPPSPAAQDDDAASFVAATAAATDEGTAALMAQLQQTCTEQFDDASYDGSSMRLSLEGAGAPVIVAEADGSIVLSFEALGPLDPMWSVRDELCQGMERLLGADLGDVRKISQLNLSIGEHLMDSTLMEALGDLLVDTVGALRAAAAGGGRRAKAAA